MNLAKVGIGLVAAVAAIVVLAAMVLVVGTFASYYVAAMEAQRPPHAPFAVACTQLDKPHGGSVTVRFDIASTSRKDATWMNFAMFAAGNEHRNLSDWSYVLKTRVPAGQQTKKTVAIPLNSDYRAVPFSSVRCNLVNVLFADGSQQDYSESTDLFP